MGLFNNLIEDKLKIKKNNRYTSVSNFSDYLAFLGYIGRIDEIYFSLRVIDKNYINNNKNDLLNFNAYKNLESLIKRVEEENTYDIKKYLLNTKCKEVEIFNLVSDFLATLKAKEASPEENFVLNFLLNILLLNRALNTDLGVSLIEYFWEVKNCNNYRRDYCIFSITDFFIESNDKPFFKLRDKFYNHIQKIYSQINKSSFLKTEDKSSYQSYINTKIRKINNLKSKTKSKVAVCVSGLYRNHNNSLESIKKNIIDPLNADVFIHTWDKKAIWNGIGGTALSGRLFGDNAKSLIPNEIINLNRMEYFLPETYSKIKNPISENWNGIEIKDILNPKKILIENESIIEDLIIDKENYMLLRGSLNQIKMFYGIKKSFDLALDFDDYDYIIRIRPDILVSNKISIEDIYNLDNNTIYTQVGEYGLQDFEFIVSSSMAYNLSKFINKMFDFNSLSPYEDFPLYDSHNLILAWLIEFNYSFDNDLFKRSLLNMSDRKISIEGLADALNKDFGKLSKDKKVKFSPFLKYLKNNYC